MAFSIDTMKKDNLLIKKTEACEVMGTVTEICTGKTATLTKNQMKVSSFFAANFFVTVSETYNLTSCNLDQEVLDLIRDCIIYNCDSRIEMSYDAKYIPVGNGIEVGMLKFL